MITFSTWITLSRIFLTPFILMAMYYHAWVTASIIFSCAAATDFFDGYYARLYHQETELGKILDPLADKILLFTTLFGLYLILEQPLIPQWFIYVVVIKDILLLLGALVLMMSQKYRAMTPSFLSKCSTALFMLFSIYMMLIQSGMISAILVEPAIILFTIILVCILVDYSYKFIQRIGNRRC